MRRVLAAALVAALACAAAPVAAPCCMVPLSWNGDVDQSDQTGVVLHHDGHEELVLRVSPFFQRKDGAPLPDVAAAAPPYVEWVVTVPSPPTGYRTVAPSVFRDADALASRLEELAERQHEARSRWDWSRVADLATRNAPASAAVTAATGLVVEPPVRVGPYEITAVRARGAEALDELNAYLAKRGFPQEDADHMAWFVERGFTFLCIHVTPPAGKDRLGKALELEPLQIGFDTPRPYYPAKFSSRQGAFALSLWTVTSRPLARASASAIARRVEARTGRWPNAWTVRALPDALGDAASRWTGVERWHVNRFLSRGFNRTGPDGRPAIAHWTDDVLFDLGGAEDDMPGWYYGDRDIGVPERLWREHRVAGGVWAGVIAVGVLGWRTVRARRRPA